jgi:hypothetical protein
MVITGKSRKQIEGLQPATIAEIIQLFEDACNTTTGELNRHLRIRKGLRRMALSMIPNLPSMSLAEHVDMDAYSNSIWSKNPDYSHLPNLMAILYRPIKERFGKWYRIAEYDSGKAYHMPFVNQITMNDVNHSLLFFSTIERKLQKSSIEYLEAEMKTQLEVMQSLP